MLQYFDTLQDDSGNALLGATVAVTAYPGGGATTIYSSNGTIAPIANATVAADITGQVSFYAPDGAYILTYSYKGTQYKVRSPVQFIDPMGFVAATDSGGVNALAVSSAAYPAQLYTGLKAEIKVAATNTGATTVAWQGGPTHPLNQPGGSALAPGMLQTNGLARIEWDGTQWQLASSQSQPFYAQSQAEINAGVIPTNTAFNYGDYQRYGADPTFISDSHTAIQNCINCNAYCYDTYPGGGKYLSNAEIFIANYPIKITGQAKGSADLNVNTGTQFILGAAAGAGAAFFGASYTDGLVIDGIGFGFNSGGLSQFGVHVRQTGGGAALSGQMRNGTITNCRFNGTGINDTNTGVRIDSSTGGAQFSSAFNINQNYFTNVLTGLWLTGNCTPGVVAFNTFIGYTAAGPSANGNGIEIDYPAVETQIVANYFEGWTTGIFSNGAAQIKQFGNDFQGCTTGFNWVKTLYSSVQNQSMGDGGVGGTFSTADGDQNQVWGRAGNYASGGPVQANRGFQEGNGAGTALRAYNVGYPQAVAFAAGNFTGNGAMTWTVILAGQSTFTFSITGKTLTVWFNISGTVGGTPNTAVQIALPGGFSGAAVTSPGSCQVFNNGAWVATACQVTAFQSVIQIFSTPAGNVNFTAGTVNAVGQLQIQIS